jgi:ribosomal protein S18 acetylase RimI-like enzyme
VELRVEPLDERPLVDAVAVLNQGFSDYFVKIHFDTRTLLRTIRYDQIDGSQSWIIVMDGEDVGACMVARRGWTSRLASMAIIPEARGKGIGTWVVGRLLRQARARGDRWMDLEVIEGNDPAIRLYESHDFKTVRRLLSFQASSTDVVSEDQLREVDIREISGLVIRYGLPDLPWQISGESLAQMGPPNRGYQLEDSFVVLSNPEDPTIVVRALITKPESRRRGMGRRVLQAAMAKHEKKSWMVPALCPQEFEAFFLNSGFELGSLAQFQMTRQLI